MRRAIDRGIVISLGAVVALLMLNAGLSFWNARRLAEDAGWVAHTHEVLALTGDVLSTLKDAETGQRGFLITGDERFLQPYHAALERIEGRMAKLRGLSAEDRRQQARIRDLERTIAARLALLREGIALRREEGFEAAQAFISEGRGKAKMDAARNLVSEMEGEERGRLRERSKLSERSYRLAVVTGPLASLLGLSAVFAFVWLLRRHLLARQEAAAAVHQQREWFRTTLASIGDAVIATDPEGRVTFLNPVAEVLTGWEQGEAIGAPLVDVFHIVDEATRKPVENPALRALEQGEVVGLANHTILLARGGAERPIEDSTSPIRGEGGVILGAVLVFRDVTGRRRLEQARRQSERELADFFENATVGLHWVGPDGAILRANRAELELLGYAREEYVGRHIAQFHADQGVICDILRRLQAGETLHDYPARLRCKDGSLKDVLIDSSVMWEEGRFVHTRCFTRDVTERRRAEEALRRSEERLRLIVESAEDYAIFTTDLDGKLVTWNSGAKNLTGYDEAEIVGRIVEALYIPEDIERGVPEQERRRAQEQGRAENERWHVRKDGSRFWASGLLMPMREGDRLVGFLKIMRDTTEQKRTEQELEVSRERLDLVVNSSEVGLWYCDLPFDKLVWNPKCKEHFGLPPDAEVTIDTFYERIHPDDREATRAAIERSIEGRTEYDAEFRTVDPQGRVRWVRAIGRAFYDVAGTPIRFDGITVDVTGRIEQEEALRGADRRKDEFLATLAHELRNPLAPIRNALHLMREPVADGDGIEAERAMAERQVVHLARLIDDLMDVARISRGQIELHKEVVDLGTVVGQAVQTARTQIDDRRHRLTVSLPDRAVRLEADPTRLEQVLWNLLNNSAKYTDPGGRIRLSVEPDGGEVVVRVRDTGIGIRPEMLPKVFDMFVQVGDHRDHAQGGLGIGLSLVRTLVEMHGGSISAHSEGPGTGSEFVVRLPILARAREDTASQQDGRRGAGEGPPRRRILVVDDNVDAAVSLARLLGRLYGQEVRVAHDGPEALSVAGEFRPEVVLLDIGLPGMDGNEVARRLRGRPDFEETLIVALTGWGQEADVERSREAGFDHHLVKPASPEAIIGLLTKAGEGDG